uniref:Predicted protein n=2 Tax=Hordeum vulgare subsp. vulgare TaxID=112509 RepID=F2CRH5_HORVV|nr:predicted protein [Hordeum vulgare subsp. vulgare]
MPSRSSTSQKIWKRMQQFFLGIAPQNSSIHFQVQRSKIVLISSSTAVTWISGRRA